MLKQLLTGAIIGFSLIIYLSVGLFPLVLLLGGLFLFYKNKEHKKIKELKEKCLNTDNGKLFLVFGSLIALLFIVYNLIEIQPTVAIPLISLAILFFFKKEILKAVKKEA